MAAVLRREALRLAWLMVGAAIGLAAVLLLVSVAGLVGPSRGPWAAVVTGALLLPVALIGLLPGVRELEVTAARSLLGVRTDLVEPARPTATHRRRTVATVLLHLALGLLAAALVVGALPGLVLTTVRLLRGEPVRLGGLDLAPAPAAGVLGLALLVALGDLLLVVVVGRLSGRAVARLLGPTAEDRLEVALRRLEAEAAHTRLARELHDGIGHALTVISLQAAAGRRVLRSEPARAESALATVEDTARGALAELDDLLGTLRTNAVVREAEPGLDRLDALLATYRSGGMTLDAEVAPLPWLAPMASATAYRVVAEGLTNAARHAGPGRVHLTVATSASSLRVRVVSPLPGGGPAAGARGLGLTGVAERVRLFGGTSSAGPEGDAWVLAADLPRTARRG